MTAQSSDDRIIVTADEHRFSRFEAIQWWDQSLLKDAVILVVGAGALGNEVIKNCALLGIGTCIIVDNDHIEQSNLSRSVLFRSEDEKRNKAECAADAARSIYPDIICIPIVGNIVADIGLGFFRRADIVISAVDNREARLFINRVCALLGKPWIDGGLDVLNGIVRGFHAPETACYECTMGKADWDLVDKRRSCSLLARQADAAGGTPTTPTTASVIGAIQVQEVIKFIHNKEWLNGRGFLFEGLNHSSCIVNYPLKKDCVHHEQPAMVIRADMLSSASLLDDIRAFAVSCLGGCDAIDIEREMVKQLTCSTCEKTTPVYRSTETLTRDILLCPTCRSERLPEFFHSIVSGSPMLSRSVSEVGLPRWDILWARHKESFIGIEIAGDTSIPYQENREAR